MLVEKIEISKLILDQKNSRKHDAENLKVIENSLKKFGQQKNIVIDKDNVVLAGNGTVIAAKAIGLTSLYVNRFNLSYKDARAFALVDNRSNELSEWDNDALRESLRELNSLNFDTKDIGFDLRDFGIEGVSDSKVDEDADKIPDDVITRVKKGEIWSLGNHRIMCGSSSEYGDVEKLAGKERFDMVFTSPPYNAGIDYESHDDSMPADQYLLLLENVLQNCNQFGTDDLWILWNMGCSHNTKWWDQIKVAEDIGFKINRTIIWTKVGTTGVPVFQHTRNKPVTKNYMPHFGYEFIFTFHKQKKLGVQQLSEDLMDRRQLDVWSVSQSGDNSKERKGHPAAFPVALAQDGIELFADKNVFEPFCGSGSTLIACEKSGRHCFGMEIDPKYCDIILQRWENYTGQTAILAAG